MNLDGRTEFSWGKFIGKPYLGRQKTRCDVKVKTSFEKLMYFWVSGVSNGLKLCPIICFHDSNSNLSGEVFQEIQNFWKLLFGFTLSGFKNRISYPSKEEYLTSMADNKVSIKII